MTLSLPTTANAVLLPNAAIKRLQAQTGVWTIEGGALRFAPVRTRPGQPGRPGPGARGRRSPARRSSCTARRTSAPHSRITVVESLAGQPAVISLAGRDILHSWGKFVLTGIGLGLLIGVTLTMAGVYRGMVDDARALLNNSGADLWVVQQDTQGPYAESSSLRDDVGAQRARPARRGARRQRHLPDDAGAARIGRRCRAAGSGDDDVRAMVVGFEPGQPGEPGYLVAGRHITRSHYEAVADVRTGFALGERIRIRRHDYTVVGLTRRMVSSGGDPMVFIPLKDAQEAQFLKDNDAIVNERARTAANPA